MIDARRTYEGDLGMMILLPDGLPSIELSEYYKLKRHERRVLINCFRLLTFQGVSEKKAHSAVRVIIRDMIPISNFRWRHKRMLRSVYYDVSNILKTDNVVFNLAMYLNVVCGIRLQSLSSSKCDIYIRIKYNHLFV